MKKRNLKSLRLNKKSVSFLNLRGGLAGGDTSNTGNHLTADIKDCPDNTLALGCESIGACPDSYWCDPHSDGSVFECWCGL